MNERDRVHTTSTWPPPELANEQGNDDQTVVTRMDRHLLQMLLDSGSAVIADPSHDHSEESK